MGIRRRDELRPAIGNNVERRSHCLSAPEVLFYAGIRSVTNEEAQGNQLEGLTGAADEIAQSGDIGAIGADAAGIHGQSQALGKI
jgi:hypothetical protein